MLFCYDIKIIHWLVFTSHSLSDRRETVFNTGLSQGRGCIHSPIQRGKLTSCCSTCLCTKVYSPFATVCLERKVHHVHVTLLIVFIGVFFLEKCYADSCKWTRCTFTMQKRSFPKNLLMNRFIFLRFWFAYYSDWGLNSFLRFFGLVFWVVVVNVMLSPVLSQMPSMRDCSRDRPCVGSMSQSQSDSCRQMSKSTACRVV